MAGPAPLGGDSTSIGAAAARSKIRHPVGGHGTIPAQLTCRYMSAWDGTGRTERRRVRRNGVDR